VVGPAPFIRLARGFIYSGDTQATVARYENRAWIVDQVAYPRIVCQQLVTLRFENFIGHAGPLIGPAPSFKVSNRHVFMGRLNVARLREDTLRWTHATTRDDWQVLRLQPHG
jgi:hypothetical protein